MAINKLTAQQVRAAKPGQKLGDGGGLRFVYMNNGSKFWEYRFRISGKDYSLGCGGETTTLAAARKRRDEFAAAVKSGKNPALLKSAPLAGDLSSKSPFRDVAEAFLESKGQEFSDKHRAKWLNPLEVNCEKVLRTPIQQIDLNLILGTLSPIWSVKTDTAKRCRQRLATVMDYARVRGLYEGPNPAGWEGSLKMLLARPSSITKTVHYAADPHETMSDILLAMHGHAGSGPDCVRWITQTLVRSAEARGTRFSEIDLENKVWHIPAERMKMGKQAHSVPLTSEAVKLIKRRRREVEGDLVFPSPVKGGVLTDVAITKAFRRGRAEGTIHGIRSSFRDWAEEQAYPSSVAERCLAHQVGNEVERAYLRSDLMDLRRKLMTDWQNYIWPKAGLRLVAND